MNTSLDNYKYISIDESGDLGLTHKSSRYFILVAFLHNEENIDRKVRKFIGKLNNNKSGKKIHILHARNDSDKVKLKLVKFLAGFEWRAKCIIVDKIKTGFDYVDLVDKIIKNSENTEEINMSLPTKNKTVKDNILKLNTKIKIKEQSIDTAGQLADFVAWSTYKKYEDGDHTFYSLVSERLHVL